MNRLILTIIGMVLILSFVGCTDLAGEPEIVGSIPQEQQQQVAPPMANANVVDTSNALPSQHPNLSTGQSIFAENCTRCHGENGEGDGELVQSGQIMDLINFTEFAERADKTPLEFYDIITNGNLETLMPPWSGSLSDAQRWSVGMYVYTLAYDQQMLATGETIYAENCVECHGEDGSGTDKAGDILTLYNHSDTQLIAQVTDGSNRMDGFGDVLSPEEIIAVSAYIRTLDLRNADNVTRASADIDSANTDTEASADVDSDFVMSGVGDVVGTVTFGTADTGIDPDDILLELHSFDVEMNDDITQGTVNEDGSFVFPDVEISHERAYIVTAQVEDWYYTSEFVPGNPNELPLELPLTVYDMTTDPESIIIESLSTQVFAEPEALQVIEIIRLRNISDKMFIGESLTSGEERTTVQISLPEGAQFIDMTGDDRYRVVSGGNMVKDTYPVRPQEPHTIHIAYSMPYESGMTVRKMLNYPLDGSIDVMVNDNGVSVASDLLSEGQPLSMGETSMKTYSAVTNLPAGDVVEYTVSGTAVTPSDVANASATGSSDSGLLPLLLIGAGGIMIVGAGVLYVSDRGKKPAVADGVSVAVGDEPAEGNKDAVNQLMKQIAELDVKFKNGAISEDVYQKQRAELKMKISALMKGD